MTAGRGNFPTGAGSFPAAGDTYQGCYVLASVVATDGESAELTLLSPNEKRSVNNVGMAVSILQNAAAGQGIDDISDWRPMTLAEAQLLQAIHSDLGIEDSRNYLFDGNGTVKQMLMSNGSVSAPTSSAAYIRPVVTETVSNE